MCDVRSEGGSLTDVHMLVWFRWEDYGFKVTFSCGCLFSSVLVASVRWFVSG